jgi:hypothetical protein
MSEIKEVVYETERERSDRLIREQKLTVIDAAVSNVDIESESANKTIQAYKKVFRENKLVAEPEDYPRDAMAHLEQLKNFDLRLDPETEVTKKLSTMIR